MKREKFDEDLLKYFNEDKKVPLSFHNAIFEVALNKNRKNKTMLGLKKVAIIVTSISTITAGTVFATHINQFLGDIFNDSKGVESAVQNNYIEENLDTVAAESQNTRIEATQMLFDDHTLDINFLAQFNIDVDLTNKENFFDIPDLLITDENNDIIYHANMEIAQEFLKQNGLKSERTDVINNRINSGIVPLEITKIINPTTCNFTLKCYSYDAKFPNCSKLYLQFNSIVLTENFNNTTISGNWKLEITVPEIFKNRNPQIYKIVDCNTDIYDISHKIYTTCTKIEITINNIDYKKWHKKSDEIKTNGNVLDSQFIKLDKCYIENEKGEKFYIANIPEHNPYGLTEKGELHAELTFDLTEFNLTDKLKVVIYTLENEEIVINLKNK